MAWSVAFLPGAEADLAALRGGVPREALEEAIAARFRGLKGERVLRALVQGSATPDVDRLAGSIHPGSIRLRLPGDHRATVFCLPAFRQAFVTHVFHKARDPTYANALRAHDRRISEYVEAFERFVARRRGR